MNTLRHILRDNRFQPDTVRDLEQKLFFEGARRRPYLVRFAVLITLSTIIATYGILADSTATVIGAMIIAPLMTPILATTAALVMGSPKQAIHAGWVVAFGVVLVISISWLIGHFTISLVNANLNTQIASRISPNLHDLAVALAAGAAGAFALSRTDVADSLPGVAIAIALVPPLSVIGLTLSQGEWGAAGGATLLFATNLLSILLAGGAVFALLDLGPASIRKRELTGDSQRRVYRYILAGVILVTVPLAAASIRVSQSTVAQMQISTLATDWLSEIHTGHDLERVLLGGDSVEIIVHGPDESLPVADLAQTIQASYPDITDVVLQIMVSRELKYTPPVAEGAGGESGGG